MQIKFEVNPEFDSPETLAAASNFLAKLAEIPKSIGYQPPQPEVGKNTGSAASGLSLSTEGSAVTGAGAEVASTADEAPAAGTSGRPRGRPRKVAELAPAPEAAAQQTTPAPAEPEGKTETPPPSGVITPATDLNLDDHVRPALGAYTAKNGIEKGVALLAEFNAKRVSELQPEQYADFVKKCEV